MRVLGISLVVMIGYTAFAGSHPKGDAAATEKELHAPQQPAAPRESTFRGRRVDLDFKDADVHTLFRLLSDVGQVNIVTADDVKGRLTIKMRDVPWDQALDVVARMMKLSYQRIDDTIHVAKAGK